MVFLPHGKKVPLAGKRTAKEGRSRRPARFVPRVEELEGRLAPAVTLSLANPAAVPEGDSGQTNMVFVVTRTGDLTPQVLVDFATAGGTARAGLDYTATFGTLDFAPNQSTATISVPVLGNTLVQPDRSFTVNLGNPRSITPSFASQQTFPTSNQPRGVAVADFNGDGKPDLALTNANSGTVSVLLNTTAAGATTFFFAPQQTFATGNQPQGVAVGDFNGDGKPDLATANWYDNTVGVYLNLTPSGNATSLFTPQKTFSKGNQTGPVAVGDFNGDGKPDIAVANWNDKTVSVFLNTTPAGAAIPSFALQQLFAAGSDPFAVAVGDFNGDGKLDLAVTNQNDNTVSVLLNTTAPGAAIPTFAPQQIFATGGGPTFIAVGDFNSDGKPDLVVTNGNDNTVSVLLNTTVPGAAAVTFTSLQTFATGKDPVAVAVGDFNGDGKPDLAVANEDGFTVSVLLNTTTAGAATTTFTPQRSFAAGAFDGSVAVGDFNSDGKPDLVVTNWNDNTVSAYLNTTATVTLNSSSATGTILDDDAPASITPVAGATPQTGPVNNPFVPLTVTVRNAAGNPVTGASVTFTAPASGPGGAFANGQSSITGTTDAKGQVTQTFTANQTAGVYTVTAVAGIVSTSFVLTNEMLFPTAPTLTGPGDTTTQTKPKLSWNTIWGAASYEIWVTNITTQNQVLDQAGLSGTSFTPTADLPLAAYKAWIRAFDAAGNPGQWSAALPLAVVAPATPTLTAPSGATNQTRPAFTWTAVTGATSYELWVNDDSKGKVFDQPGLAGTSYTPPNDLSVASYTAWARAVLAGGAVGPWSLGLSFTVGGPPAPTLTNFADQTTNTQPTFTWNAVTGATSYEVWLNNVSAVDRASSPGLVFDQTGVTATSLTPTTPLTLGTYQIALRSANAGGYGPWSTTLQFRVTSLLGSQFRTESAELTTQKPTLTWDAVPGASAYDLWVSNNTTGQVLHPTNLTGTSYTPTADLPPAKYTVWVRAKAGDAGQTTSAWSPALDFAIVPLTTPAITGPATPTTATKPAISWGQVTGAIRYELWVNNQTTGQTAIIHRTNLTATSFVPPDHLTPGTYQAWVKAYAADGKTSAWSATYSFTIALPQAPLLGLSGTTAAPTVAWNAGADHYEIWIDNLSTGQSQVVDQRLSENSYATMNILTSGTYQVWVRPFNDTDLAGDWSEGLTFTIGS